MPLNPYASYLGDRDPLEVLPATAKRLSEWTNLLGRDGVERALSPGKWSARKILCHLADTEVAFAFRLRQALAEPHHVIQPFEQDQWARTYDAFAAGAAVELFAALRAWNLTLIRTVEPATLSKPVTHPERGPMTLQVLIETMAGHDLNHLGQLEAIASRTAGA
jgi:hypothetical protein